MANEELTTLRVKVSQEVKDKYWAYLIFNGQKTFQEDLSAYINSCVAKIEEQATSGLKK